jgi:hypothetical protein
MNGDMTSPVNDALTTPRLSIGPATQFWWATQSENFPTVYHDGTLWAPLRGSLGQRVAHWDALNKVRPGDLVLNYSAPEIRGISRAATAPAPAHPPRGYHEPSDTEGILVLTDPLHELRVPRDLALGILPEGRGPATKIRTPRRGYFFEVDRESALQLLRQEGLEINEDPDGEREQAGSSGTYLGGANDRWAIGAVRTEQRFLRSQQLQRRGSSCSLCGLALPEELLIAAHIKPRSACSEKERMDTRNVSMLACLFGCDALFELGYVVVGEDGIIEAGRPASGQVWDRIEGLVGRRCRAHDDHSRLYFAWHRQHQHDKQQ